MVGWDTLGQSPKFGAQTFLWGFAILSFSASGPTVRDGMRVASTSSRGRPVTSGLRLSATAGGRAGFAPVLYWITTPLLVGRHALLPRGAAAFSEVLHSNSAARRSASRRHRRIVGTCCFSLASFWISIVVAHFAALDRGQSGSERRCDLPWVRASCFLVHGAHLRSQARHQRLRLRGGLFIPGATSASGTRLVFLGRVGASCSSNYVGFELGRNGGRPKGGREDGSIPPEDVAQVGSFAAPSRRVILYSLRSSASSSCLPTAKIKGTRRGFVGATKTAVSATSTAGARTLLVKCMVGAS